MHLIKDLSVSIPKNLKDRLHLSNGVIETNRINGYMSKSRTFIPNTPWRNPSEKEWHSLELKENEQPTIFTGICLEKLPKKFIRQFQLLEIENLQNNQQAFDLEESQKYKDLVNRLIKHYEQFARIKKSSIPHNLFLGESNLTTTTFNKRENYYIGLHLDSFESREKEIKRESRNRICINLGKEPRYLYFYNLSLDKMAELCGHQSIKSFENPYPIVHDFFSKFHDYPVIRLTILPYELYIAPTEYIVHDGSTLGTKSVDINLVIRGYFQPSKNIFSIFIKNIFQNHYYE